MLAKLKTFSLVGIDALPVEVEVDVSPGRSAQARARRPAGGRGQGEHAPRRAGDGQLGLSAAAKPRGHQSGPRRSAQGGRLVRSADRPGHSGRQRTGRLRAARAVCGRRRAGPRRHHPADQRRPLDGHGRRRADRAPRPAGARPKAPPRRRWSKGSRSSPSPASPRRWPS